MLYWLPWLLKFGGIAWDYPNNILVGGVVMAQTDIKKHPFINNVCYAAISIV